MDEYLKSRTATTLNMIIFVGQREVLEGGKREESALNYKDKREKRIYCSE